MGEPPPGLMHRDVHVPVHEDADDAAEVAALSERAGRLGAEHVPTATRSSRTGRRAAALG